MKTTDLVTLFTTGLLLPSVWVFFRGAGDEPYVVFRASDAVVQIGVASALMALWIVLLSFIGAQVVKKKLHRAWISAMLVGALALCCLYQSPMSYISDLVHFRVVVQ